MLHFTSNTNIKTDCTLNSRSTDTNICISTRERSKSHISKQLVNMTCVVLDLVIAESVSSPVTELTSASTTVSSMDNHSD